MLLHKEMMEKLFLSLIKEILTVINASKKEMLTHILRHIKKEKVLENFLFFITLQEQLQSKQKEMLYV